MTARGKTASSGTFKFRFAPNPRARKLDAAWRIAARVGIRGLNHSAIAKEVGRQLGTVGKIKIAEYLHHIVGYPFQPLLALSEGERFRTAGTQDGRIACIDAMLGKDSFVASGVMQARAMAATPQYRDVSIERRAEAAATLTTALSLATGCSENPAGQAEALIRYYLEQSGRVAGTA